MVVAAAVAVEAGVAVAEEGGAIRQTRVTCIQMAAMEPTAAMVAAAAVVGVRTMVVTAVTIPTTVATGWVTAIG